MENFRDSANHQCQINGVQSYDNLFDQFDQNPNSSQRYPITHTFTPQPSLEDVFSRMNLNNIPNTRTGSAIFPGSFIDYKAFNVNNGTVNSLLPSMYNQQFFHPPAAAPPRVSRTRDWSLMELRGLVWAVARDQNGCRLMQKRLDHDGVTREEIDMVFVEVMMQDDLHELMVHHFANYLVQKLFNATNQLQRTQILEFLVNDHQRFFQVCTNINGSRTIQKFMERITTREQRRILLSALKPGVVFLTNNGNGHHIIEQCLHKFPSSETTPLTDEIAFHCFVIATNKNGCCVLQKCLQHATPFVMDRLLARITANALLLSEDEFGNYVVQCVIGLRSPYITTQVIRQLQGNFVALSFNKYGSHVVQKCLEQSEEHLSAMIIREIMNHRDFAKVIGHGYGNYVIQSALLVAKGDIRNALLAMIRQNYFILQSSPFGSSLLNRAKGRKDNI